MDFNFIMTMDQLEVYLMLGLLVAVVIYGVLLVLEKKNLMNFKIPIKSKKVTQTYIDSLDYTAFKLGKTRLNIGDEIKVITKAKTFKGMLLGARKKDEALCLLSRDDEIQELSISSIYRLKVLQKYGRIF